MKITEQELKNLVNEVVAKKIANIKEAAAGDPGTEAPSAKEVVSFMKEFDDFLTETVEKAHKLADKGETLIKENLLNTPETGTRNEVIITRVGMLRSMANGVSTFFERVRRFSP